MPTNCCGHFSADVELISLPHTPVVLRVPVRRCALAERMIAIVSRTEDGRAVAEKIQIMQSSRSNAEGEQLEIRAAFGPDLDAITRADCTPARCQESCTPGFRQVVRYFGYATDADDERGEGCAELPTDIADVFL